MKEKGHVQWRSVLWTARVPPIHRPLDKVGSEKGARMVNNLSRVLEKKKKDFRHSSAWWSRSCEGEKKIERKRPEVVVKDAQGFPSFSHARLPYNLPLHGSPAPADS